MLTMVLCNWVCSQPPELRIELGGLATETTVYLSKMV